MTTDAHDDLDPVRVAREACAEYLATLPGGDLQAMGDAIRAGRNDDCVMMKDTTRGARAMKAACEAAGAKPVLYGLVSGNGTYLEEAFHHADEAVEKANDFYNPRKVSVAPLYAHPPAVAAGRAPAPGQHAGLVEQITFDAWFDRQDAVVRESLSRRAFASIAWHDIRRHLDARITALEADNKAKDARIAELEDAVSLFTQAARKVEWIARATAAETELRAIDSACPRVRGMSIIDAIKGEQDDAIRLLHEKMDERARREAAETELAALRGALVVAHNCMLKVKSVVVIDEEFRVVSAALATAKEG